MWTAYLLPPGGGPPSPVSDSGLPASLQSAGLLWLDVAEPTRADEALLTDLFRFHPLAVEDAIAPRLNAPKIDDYGAYLFVVVQGVDPRSPGAQPEPMEVDLFIGPNYLVTCQLAPVDDIKTVRDIWLEGLWRSADRPDTLAHLVIDRLVDEFLPAVEALEERVEEAEERAVRLSPRELSDLLPSLRRTVGRLDRVAGPQREVLYRLSRPEWALIQERNLAYFRDIYDHVVRMEALLEGLHQRLDLVLQLHLAAVANRTNEVVKILSLVGTIFLPLTFVVGVYGMNFRYLPELDWRYGYFLVWGFMGLLTLGMLAYFRWRRWL